MISNRRCCSRESWGSLAAPPVENKWTEFPPEIQHEYHCNTHIPWRYNSRKEFFKWIIVIDNFTNIHTYTYSCVNTNAFMNSYLLFSLHTMNRKKVNEYSKWHTLQLWTGCTHTYIHTSPSVGGRCAPWSCPAASPRARAAYPAGLPGGAGDRTPATTPCRTWPHPGKQVTLVNEYAPTYIHTNIHACVSTSQGLLAGKGAAAGGRSRTGPSLPDSCRWTPITDWYHLRIYHVCMNAMHVSTYTSAITDAVMEWDSRARR